MNASTRIRALILLTAFGLSLPGLAAAQLPESAVDCRAAIAKNYAKLMKTAHKTIAGCHKSRDGGKVLDTTDCNDMTQADVKLKFDSTRIKTVAAINTACAAEDATLTSAAPGAAYYLSCPVPCGALPNPLTTMSQVAECLGCFAESVAESAGTGALGSPAPASLTKDDIKCRSTVAKAYGKYAATGYKAETSCQSDADELGDHDLAACTGNDPNGKVLTTLTKAGENVDKSCAFAVLANLDTCAVDTVENLKACSAVLFGDAENDVFEATYEMDATICPQTISLTTLDECSTLEAVAGGCSTGGQTRTSWREGWRNRGHDLVDAVTLALDVSCPGTPGACGACTVGGFNESNPAYSGFARCEDSPWIPCTSLFAADGACGGGACTYFANPPIPVSTGGFPTCVLSQFDNQVSGTINPDSGSSALTMQLRSRFHTGISQSRPCPICRDDVTAQDGLTGGTCFGGPRDGMPCDVQGFDLTFGGDAPLDGPSLDCPPALGSEISGPGLTRELPLTTGVAGKTAVDACESPLGAFDCHCGVCSLNDAVVCDDDADCAGMALGVCGKGTGNNRQPNSCGDLTCEAIPGNSEYGECGGEIDLYCDELLHADGSGVLYCGVDSDCNAYSTGSMDPDDWVCPGDDCGTCSLGQTPTCFRDTISVSGTASSTAPVLVGLSCVAPSGNALLNSIFGLPGPLSVTMETLLEKGY